MVLTMGLLFLPVAHSLGQEPDGEDLPAEGKAASRGLLSSLQERFKAARQRPFVETADEVLSRCSFFPHELSDFPNRKYRSIPMAKSQVHRWQKCHPVGSEKTPAGRLMIMKP